MKAVILGIVIVLAGCATPVPVKRSFPDAVPELKEKCPPLQLIEGNNVSITDMLKIIVKNYGSYYECSNKLDGWNEWYSRQKKLFEEVE